MTPIEPNTRVRILACRCRYTGLVGVVGAVVDGQRAPYRVDGLEPWALWFTREEIQAIYEGEK